jgi:predicted amino acid-binding ACT domain protein
MAPLDDRPADRGEVLDVVFDIVYARFDTNISSCSDSSREDHHEIMRDIVGEDGHDDHADDVDEARLRREQRKERVMERLEKYREDHSRLRAACSALESALEMTSQKLRKVDKGAASRIRALELELRDAREGGEATRTNQEACIKELGKKLIRQAHVIKRQRDAVEQLKMQLEAMAEEMAMQDERDSRREEDLRRLEEQLENSRDNQAQMQAMLQENIEGMVELKSEVERDAKNIMELEFDLGQKEALLNRVARDLAEKTERICELEQGLEDKIFEMESMTKELDESKESAEVMRQQFEAAAKQLDESRESVEVMQQQLEAAMKQLDESKDSAELVRQQLEAATKEGEDMKFEFSRFGTTKTDDETVGDVAANAQSPRSLKRPSLAKGDVINKMDKPPLVQGRDGEDEDNEIGMKEAFASELQAKDATIRTLDDACKEMEATINAQRSEMVKMSSTYREDSYLKRKEIAELTKQKAAYALKLRALEKAFQCVSATGNITTVSTSSHSTHGGGGGMGAASLDNKSVHQESHGGKEGKAAAVSARLGGFRLWGDSKVVKEANFFDDDAVSDSPALSDRGSISGGKGEDPEEC